MHVDSFGEPVPIKLHICRLHTNILGVRSPLPAAPPPSLPVLTPVHIITMLILFQWFCHFFPLFAAQLTTELTTLTEQRVKQGNAVSFSCKTNGTVLSLYAPPFINENIAFNLFSTDSLDFCVVRNAAFLHKLSDDGDITTFSAILTIYIPANQISGSYTMFCVATDATGQQSVSNTTFVVGDEDSSQISNPNSFECGTPYYSTAVTGK